MFEWDVDPGRGKWLKAVGELMEAMDCMYALIIVLNMIKM